MAVAIIFQIVFPLWGYLTGSSDPGYPKHLTPEEVSDHFLEGAHLSFTVDPSDCRVLDQYAPPLKNYSFGGDIGHSRYVLYGPLSNFTYWTQRYVDNRDVKRIGPVLRLTGLKMDATGFAYVYIKDYDPLTWTILAHLTMLCGSYRGFLPYAQTPGGRLVDFDDVTKEISKGSILSYCIFPTWCNPRLDNQTHSFIDSGQLDEYRYDGNGNVVFTYRILNEDLSVDVTTVKMTSPTDISIETYSFNQETGKSGTLHTKNCTYGYAKTFGIYKINSPQSGRNKSGNKLL